MWKLNPKLLPQGDGPWGKASCLLSPDFSLPSNVLFPGSRTKENPTQDCHPFPTRIFPPLSDPDTESRLAPADLPQHGHSDPRLLSSGHALPLVHPCLGQSVNSSYSSVFYHQAALAASKLVLLFNWILVTPFTMTCSLGCPSSCQQSCVTRSINL